MSSPTNTVVAAIKKHGVRTVLQEIAGWAARMGNAERGSVAGADFRRLSEDLWEIQGRIDDRLSGDGYRLSSPR